MRSAQRIWGLVYRHLALYRGSWPRLLEIAYWPVVQMLVWGFTSRFLGAGAAGQGGAGAAGIVAGALLGGVLLWEVALRAQMGLSISFLEEIWSRNLGHLFVSPLRPAEMLLALLLVSTGRLLLGVVPAAVLAWAFYRFDLLALGPVLALFLANLMVMGWWVALGVVALILRHGAGAESLAWSVLFGLAPLSAVFYPVAVFPAWLRPVSLALPSTHVFEGMRAALAGGAVRWDHLAAAAGLNLLWLGLALWLFAREFRHARETGALVTMGE